MRPPTLRQQIYGTLKQRILQRDFMPGELFTPEPELAREYGIARGTLRSVLDMLEEDGLIERIRGKGTCVRKKRRTARITYLMPCPMEDLKQANAIYTAQRHTALLQGIMRMAYSNTATVELIPVSPTNNPDDVDWDRLFNLDRNARIILPGTWYKSIFDYLLKLGCRTLLIHENNFLEKHHRDTIRNFMEITMDNVDMTKRLTAALIAHGSRHPAIVTPFIKSKDTQRLKGFLQAIDEAGLNRKDAVIVELPALQATTDYPLNHLNERLVDAYSQTPFDALIIEACHLAAWGNYRNAAQILGWRKNVTLATFNTLGMPLDGYEQLLAIDFDLTKIGEEAAATLLATNPAETKKIVLADDIAVKCPPGLRESSHVQPSLPCTP